MPTEKQIKTLETIGEKLENEHTAHVTLGVSRATLGMRQTELFKEFLEDLDLMLLYYPIFERRFSNEMRKLPKGGNLYSKLRRLARLINKERD